MQMKTSYFQSIWQKNLQNKSVLLMLTSRRRSRHVNSYLFHAKTPVWYQFHETTRNSRETKMLTSACFEANEIAELPVSETRVSSCKGTLWYFIRWLVVLANGRHSCLHAVADLSSMLLRRCFFVTLSANSCDLRLQTCSCVSRQVSRNECNPGPSEKSPLGSWRFRSISTCVWNTHHTKSERCIC